MPKKAIIQFTKVIQDSQDLGSDEDFMQSRLFFNITISDLNQPDEKPKIYNDLYCNVRQAAGTDYEEDPIEVDYPKDFDEQIPYFPYTEAAERCYRRCVGSTANGIMIVGSKNIRMRNNTFGVNHIETLSMPDYGGGWQFD